jgi:hypothetical protein
LPTDPADNPAVTAFAAALEAGISSNMVTTPYSIPLPWVHVSRSSTGGLVTPQ